LIVEYAPRKIPDIENPGHDPSQTHPAIDKQDYPDSEMDEWDWDALELPPSREPPSQLHDQQRYLHRL